MFPVDHHGGATRAPTELNRSRGACKSSPALVSSAGSSCRYLRLLLDLEGHARFFVAVEI